MKKTIPAYILLFLIPILTRVLFGEYFFLYGVTPNVLLIIIVVMSVIVPKGWLHIGYAFYNGIINDVVYCKQIGFHIILFVITSTAISYARSKIMKNNILFCLLFVFVATILYEFTAYVFFGYFNTGIGLDMLLKRNVLPEVSANILITPIIYVVFNVCFGFLADEKGVV